MTGAGTLESASLPTCSVVICTRDRPSELEQCIALVRAGEHAPTELIIVDSGPSSSASRLVAERLGVTYVVEEVAGLSRARNRGARVATADVVAYIDDDARPDASWLRNLLLEFRDPTIAAVCGRCIPTFDPGTVAIAETMQHWWSNDTCRRVFSRDDDSWADAAIGGRMGTGMNMAFRRRALAGSAIFDTRLGRGAAVSSYEEHEALFSLVLHGERVVYTPEALVTHPVPGTQEAFARFREDTRSAFVAYLLLLFTKYPQARRHIIGWTLRAGVRRKDVASVSSRVTSPFAYLRAVAKGTALFALASRR